MQLLLFNGPGIMSKSKTCQMSKTKPWIMLTLVLSSLIQVKNICSEKVLLAWIIVGFFLAVSNTSIINPVFSVQGDGQSCSYCPVFSQLISVQIASTWLRCGAFNVLWGWARAVVGWPIIEAWMAAGEGYRMCLEVSHWPASSCVWGWTHDDPWIQNRSYKQHRGRKGTFVLNLYTLFITWSEQALTFIMINFCVEFFLSSVVEFNLFKGAVLRI